MTAGPVDAILEAGLQARTVTELLDRTVACLLEAGMPIWRAQVSFPTVDPRWGGLNHVWMAETGTVREGVDHDRMASMVEASPFRAMLQQNQRFRRWCFAAGDEPGGFAVLNAARDAGATDYLLHLVSFEEGSTSALKGAALSLATRAPGGFTGEQVTLATGIVPAVALAAFRVLVTEIASEVLGAYIGHDAGRRVLCGEIRRGIGTTQDGAILFADLVGFTAASEKAGPAFVARLDQHLEAMASSVEAAGGEVLKFLGDGILAAFPLDPQAPDPCGPALDAARDAIRRNGAVNARFPDTEPLALDVALHRGEVFYGNVGGGSRLDFTVIGPAVNEASRIEALCGPLSRSVLMSAAFAASCGCPAVSLGFHTLKGVSTPREVFGLVE